MLLVSSSFFPPKVLCHRSRPLVSHILLLLGYPLLSSPLWAILGPLDEFIKSLVPSFDGASDARPLNLLFSLLSLESFAASRSVRAREYWSGRDGSVFSFTCVHFCIV